MNKIQEWTSNSRLIKWIKEMELLCKPASISLCNGSLEEYERLCAELTAEHTFVALNPKSRPGSYACCSHPDDVARVEQATFICTESKEDAGPTNNWKDPKEMHALLHELFDGCMEGRTMYVVPFSMGPLGSSMAHIGVQITDSPYVVVNTRLTTRMGTEVLKVLKEGFFVPCMHSVGAPLKKGEKDVLWPCNPTHRYIVHFPEEKAIFSFGSGYGGNALLGKKCFALRLASYMGKKQMWMAEHMMIIGVTNPKGEKKYFAGAFPSACGKTNLAMLKSALPGWKIECVGDDIAWMKFKEDGRLYAINPEAGFFGVAPGTSYESNPYAMQTIAKNTIFTNVALTKDHDVWWEGMTKEPPPFLTDWKGHPWTKNSGTPAAQPNARFTVSATQCPIIDPAWEDPEGVPLSGIIFGGRRSKLVPLVTQSFNWEHGVFLGASVSSERTAAAEGELGSVRHDPFAMLPFCGYNMGDYFGHWLEMGKQTAKEKLPLIFYVNWFRKSEEGEFLWPGFGDNIRILKWCFERTEGIAEAMKTPIGWIPTQDSLDLLGMPIKQEALGKLLYVDQRAYLREVEELENYFSIFGNRLPQVLKEELNRLKKRLLNINPLA